MVEEQSGMSVGDPRLEPGQARVGCPWCKKVIIADMSVYTLDMSTPLRSKCPMCNGDIYTALVILSHKTLPQLGKTIEHVIQAVEEQANPLVPDKSGTILEGDGH